ncbi:MAG: ABC transporter ATP-binding protein [Treponema sp.]|jgi:ABC-2 type transport system ATP-binding protein|nr:ABC transporter ATP-binding protein [Treponema sp.]
MITDSNPVIETFGICKKYGSVTALSGINFLMQPGTITGLIGPDGAGKSTLIRIILTLLRSDSGTCSVFGLTPEKNKKQIRTMTGYMPETFSLYSDLTVEENLQFSFRIHGMNPALYQTKLNQQYEFNRLRYFAKSRAGTLSGGMKQKLALSCAMMHDPRLLVLDEPTTGVDPLSRREFWQLLNELKNKGVSILVATPYMDEALRCDSVYFMFRGGVMSSGSPSDLIASFSGCVYEITTDNEDPEKLIRQLQTAKPAAAVYLSGRNIHFGLYARCARDDCSAENDIRPLLSKKNVVHRITPDLEDLFMMRILTVDSGDGHAPQGQS